jgi:hypothetical protein
MNLIELIKATDSLPDKAKTANGTCVAVDVQRNGKLGYIARLWQVTGGEVKEWVLEYGTGRTPIAAREALKSKLLKQNK